MYLNYAHLNVFNFPFFAMHFQKVRLMPLDEVVIFDADTNTIESPFDDVAQLPSDAVSFNY